MKAFEYASPRTEREVLEQLSLAPGRSEVLAGGTDLVGLMKQMLVTPDRVISLSRVPSLKFIQADSQGVRLGSMVTLEELLDNPVSDFFPAIKHVLSAFGSQQFLAQGTLGGELCQRPRCWYFRSGQGLLAHRGQNVAEGDSRFHAILGNSGPAKFVSPSRLAPALIALGAMVRIIGPEADNYSSLPLEMLYRTPKTDREREHELSAGQLVAQIVLPHPDGRVSASYEVQHGVGPDYPLASASVSLAMRGDIVADARVVLGQVAPTPWISREAAESIIGQPVTVDTATLAGEAAVAAAAPLKDNEYKVQLAQVAVKRALLLAAGHETGGF